MNNETNTVSKDVMAEIIKKTACVTGHRNVCDKMNDTKAQMVITYFNNVIDQLVAKGVTYFISGGAVGTDLLFAYAVHNAKKKYPQIKNLIAIPFKAQPQQYNSEEKKFYDFIITVADKTCYVDELQKYKVEGTKNGEFHNAKYQKRNEFMVDNSDYVIALFTGAKSGTKNCVDYANKLKKKIIISNPSDKFKTFYYNFK